MELENDQVLRKINVTPDPTFLNVLSKLEVPPEGCICELVDNSLDNFKSSGISGGDIRIKINHNELEFSDNGSGLTLDEVEQALTAASSTKSKVGELGLFGIGFNLATSKLGSETTLLTKTTSEKSWIKVVVDPHKMSRNQSYDLQPESVELDSELSAGLIVKIKLRKDFNGMLQRPAQVRMLRSQLGKAYTYILRSEVPGLPQSVAGDQRDFSIYLNDEKVTPHIPCIWDQTRKMANGSEAVQLVDTSFSEAKICQSCGAEQEPDHSGPCSECGGIDFIDKTRRIWGWLGVQRSLETEEYGIDLIRHGRTIESKSKDFFKFRDPDTEALELEYPIEQTNRGRIVGEIHCDHVPVEFTKQSFERGQDYRQMHGVVRGRTWLRPNYAKQHLGAINESKLAILYAGVRRLDPGKKYLIPGNGDKAIHLEAKNWAAKFHAGDDKYRLDTKWWDACVSHDDLAVGETDKGGAGEAKTPGPDPFAPKPSKTESELLGEKKPKTIKEHAEEWRAGAAKREDLSKALFLKIIDHKFEITVWESVTEIKLDSEISPRPSYLMPTTGANFEIFVSKRHFLLQQFSRSATDIALGEAAHHLTKQGTRASYGEVLAELITKYPEEEKSENVTRQKCNALKDIIRARLPILISNRSKEVWAAIATEQRSKIEAYAADNSQIDLTLIGERGEFARYISWRALIEVIAYIPEAILDNQLFSQSMGGKVSTLATKRVLGTIISAIKDLIIFEEVGEGISKFERDRAEISISFLLEKLAAI
jgi:hypothetical protein